MTSEPYHWLDHDNMPLESPDTLGDYREESANETTNELASQPQIGTNEQV
jgi:hypothetical protein